MNIIICGAGKSVDKQTIINPRSFSNCNRPVLKDIKRINDTQDVKGIVGRASLPSVLEMLEQKMI